MKEYKSNEELINYLLSKGVVISNKKDALEKIERYTYYSIVNTYKNIFKDKRCMEKLLTKEQYKELYNSICEETRKLEEKLKSVEINNITKIMGFPMNNN